MRRLSWGLTALVLAACSNNAGPTPLHPPVPSAKLHVLIQDSLAKPLLSTHGAFWAKVGEDRLVRLVYQGTLPTDSGEEFLRFEVPGDGLYKRPDGSLFQPGDSILITVTVVNATRFQFDFQPAGLQFNPIDPARLKVEYLHADPDFNGDGVVDSTDVKIENDSLDLWRNEPPDTLWYDVGAVKIESTKEFDGNVPSFSQYAVAW